MRSMVEGHVESQEELRVPLHHPSGGPLPLQGRNYGTNRPRNDRLSGH